ncbi:MAG: hypothetical protein BWK78_00125 [Thiotrichaceae bacterium IS1]|nr:MAG: hypothetical protein BWK78_00125 [Thiotrichaceae bacterium IS1]
MPNPYRIAPPVGGTKAFVGRRDILDKVNEVVRSEHENALVLYGQRRMGKTSILQHVEAEFKKEGSNCYTIFFDLQRKETWSLKEFLQDLAKRVKEVLSEEIPPEVTDQPETQFSQWLAKLLNKLPGEKSLVFLLDEFDDSNPQTADEGATTFYSYLYQLLGMNRKRLNFIVAISRKVEDMSLNSLAFFRGIPFQQVVSLLSLAESTKLIRLSEEEPLTLRWPEPALNKVYQLANGHPLFTQSICFSVWEHLDKVRQNIATQGQGSPATVVAKHVEEVIPKVFEANKVSLQWLWNKLSQFERVVASALASVEKTQTLSELEALLTKEKAGLSVRKLEDALTLLKELDFIEGSSPEGYRFRVEIIRLWVNKTQSFSDLVHSLNPATSSLYEAGLKLFENGEQEDAIKTLEMAVKYAPNHIKANLLLAEILQDRKQWEVARNVLENLHKSRPVAARDPLVSLLWAWVTNENNPPKPRHWWTKMWWWVAPCRQNSLKKQKDLCDRIKELNDNHQEATQKLKEIDAICPRWRVFVENFYQTHLKPLYKQESFWQPLALIMVMVVTFYWFKDYNPTTPTILFEVEKDTTSPTTTYLAKGVVSDKPYILESVEISLPEKPAVTQVTFKYDIYNKEVAISKRPAGTYEVSKGDLQQALGKNDLKFQFPPANGNFLFSFQFEKDLEKGQTVFNECKALSASKENIDCGKPKGKGYLSYFRGIPWYAIATVLYFIAFGVIRVFFIFKKSSSPDTTTKRRPGPF